MNTTADDDALDADSIAAAIGYIAMEAARLERIVGVLQLKLLCSPIGEAVMQGQPWGVVKQTCLTLIGVHEYRLFSPDDPRARGDALINLRALLADADRLMQDRNVVIHGSWYFILDEDEAQLTTYLAKRWGKGDRRRWRLRELRELQANLQKVTNQVAYHTR